MEKYIIILPAGSMSRSVGTRMLTSTIVNKAFVLIITSVCLCVKRESLKLWTIVIKKKQAE